MKEQEYITELSKAIVMQAEEKIAIGKWALELFIQIDENINNHFKNNKDNNSK